MPIPVQEASNDSIEKTAYSIVEDIETKEMNDRNRLAYHIYLFMKNEYPSLEEAVLVAQARSEKPATEIFHLIAQRLRDRGYAV